MPQNSHFVVPSNRTEAPRSHSPSPLGPLVLVGIWFGMVTGLVEGAGLLVFQRVNWARWGPMMHVSEEILWISPLVDLILFLILALLVGSLARLARRIPAVRVFVFLLTFLTAYDWLTLTGRLHHGSCFLLALGVAVAFSRWFGRREGSALQLWKRTTPWVLAAFVLVFVGIQGGAWLRERSATAELPAAAPGSPNVLVIVVDTLRADHLSSYGYARATSPNMDRIAQQGALFENAIATCSWSLPSHVSLVTGRYVYEHGVSNVQQEPWLGWGHSGLGGYPTLGEGLARKGYRTGAFSANRTFFSHDLGFGRGFLHFEDYFHSPTDMFVRTLYGKEFARIYLARSDKSLGKRILRRLGFTSLLDQDAEGSGSFGGAFGIRKRADVVNDEVLRWIARDRSRPFFAFLNYFDVHYPYGGPQAYPKPSWGQTGTVDAYDDSVKYVDDYIGRLMQELERRGLATNTLMVITSDHGESLGQHGLDKHGRALYWDQVHVPLVIWYPGHVPTNVRVTRHVTNAAIPATILSLLGGDEQAQFPGPALDSLWNRVQPEPRWSDPVSELAQRNYASSRDKLADQRIPTATTGAMKSLVTQRWHVIMHEKLGDQIYDWTQDAGEVHNLINTPEGRRAGLSLTAQLQGALASHSPTGRAERMTSPLPLPEGTSDFQPTTGGIMKPVNDYYHIAAEPGARVTIEVRARRLKPASRLDPVLVIADAQGELLQTCRNPGDDHLPPELADPTPDAFDDICMNDDIEPGVNADSKLELLTPGSGGSPVELFVRVFDWNGRRGSSMGYQIAVSGARQGARTPAAHASGRQPPGSEPSK
jgi:arylsulfatase A-like enzyme